MVQFIRPDSGPTHYVGLDEIFEYTNWDGSEVDFNCGQAAAATFLTCQGCYEPVGEKRGE